MYKVASETNDHTISEESIFIYEEITRLKDQRLMEKVEITVVGAGIVGLAIAAELSKTYNDILVIEKNLSFGQETSSRNSEVIHAGIYYPKDSMKATMCVEGKELLYAYCAQNNIGHKKIGKLIVAVDRDEVNELESLLKHGQENGVEGLKLLSKNEIKKLEPYIKAEAALYSPSTGILDSHGVMKSLILESRERKTEIVYNTEVTGIQKREGGYKVFVSDKQEGVFSFFTRVLINAAGLNSEAIAKMAGVKKEAYALKYCKGDYFRVHNNKARFLTRLIYPVPHADEVSLGIHASLDLSGGLRLGPDAEYINGIDYTIDESKGEVFYEKARRFLPFVEPQDLSPDTAGIRPKLQGPGEDVKDFLIKEEADNDLRGFINLIGIDSPGLTCCLSIAKEVKGIIKSLF